MAGRRHLSCQSCPDPCQSLTLTPTREDALQVHRLEHFAGLHAVDAPHPFPSQLKLVLRQEPRLARWHRRVVGQDKYDEDAAGDRDDAAKDADDQLNAFEK